MNADASEKMLTRIRALLTKAEDSAATPAEAETYTAKATELMAKYGIDRAMLAATGQIDDRPGDRIIGVDDPYAIDKQNLLSHIGMALGCRTVLKRRGRNYSVHLFGYGADLERVDMLFTSLLLQAVNGMAQAEPEPWESTTAFRKSWLAGFSATVYRRIREAEERAKQDATTEQQQSGTGGPSVALVLADRSTLVERAYAEAYPKIGKARKRRLSGSGWHGGAAAGRRADLGGTRVGRAGRSELTGGEPR